MAETVATLAIKTTLDGTELAEGFRRQEAEMNRFAANAKKAGATAASGLQGRAGGGGLLGNRPLNVLGDLVTGDVSAAFNKAQNGLGDFAADASTRFGLVGQAALAAAGAIVGIGIAARSVGREAAAGINIEGMTEASIRAAQRAQQNFNSTGVSVEGSVRSSLAHVDEFLSGIASDPARLLRLLPAIGPFAPSIARRLMPTSTIETIPSTGSGTDPRRRRAFARRKCPPAREQVDLAQNLRRDAVAAGLVSADATQAELDAVRELVVQRRATWLCCSSLTTARKTGLAATARTTRLCKLPLPNAGSRRCVRPWAALRTSARRPTTRGRRP